MKVRELIIHWGFDVDDAPLKQLEQNIKSAKSIITKTAIAITGISAATGFLLRQAGKFEQWEISFETMLGSAEKAKKLLDDIKEFARKTPFTLPEVVQNIIKLRAYNIESEKLIPTLKMLGDIAAGVGKEKLPALTLALGQVRTATILRGQEMRQFTEAGVGLTEELAKILKVIPTKVADIMRKGQITFEHVEQALINMTSEGGRFFNLMDKLSKTFFGILSNIADFFIIISINIGKKLLPRAKELSNQFLTFLEVNREFIELKIDKILKIFLNYFEKILNIIRSLANSFMILIKFIGGFESALKLATLAMSALLALNLIAVLGSIALVIGSVTTAIKKMGTTALIAQLKIGAMPIAIGAAILLLIAIIDDLVAYFQGRKSITGIILEKLSGLRTKLTEIFKSLKERIIKMANDSKSPLGKMVYYFKELIGPSLEFFALMRDFVKSDIFKLFATTLGLILFPFMSIFKVIKPLLIYIKDNILPELLNQLRNIVPIVFGLNLIKPIFQYLMEKALPAILEYLEKIFPLFEKIFLRALNPAIAFLGVLKNIKDILAEISLSKAFEGFKKIGGIGSKVFEFGRGLFNPSELISQLTGGPSQLAFAGASAGAAVGGKNIVNNMKVDNQINVNVPPETPVEIVGEKIKEGTSEAIQKIIRQTHKLIEDRGEYWLF